MKGRSHRPQSSDPPDDWVDGSWTVDCVCGVTFDDGEEMVKCDECGVWVHTRCSRYVKGDDTFSCDKCKSKANKSNNNNRPDSIAEETEVAQLLIELPTKTMSLEKNHHPHHHHNKSNSFSASKVVASRSRRPFKLWTDKPMEERVHVQGIPGGDPALFAGKAVPSIFGPQLWKCTGYVPKKFNFQYREFPYWDDEKKNQDAQENDNGAGVLFSFSKETSSVLASPVAALVDMRSSHGKAASFKDMGMGKFSGEEDAPRVQSAMKKESSWLRPLVHSSKRRKEDFANSNSKDKSGKKRVRTSDKDVDPRRRSSHSSKTAFPPTSDAKQMDFYEDRAPKIFKADTRSLKNKNLKDIVVQEHISNDFTVDTIVEEPNNNLTVTEESSEALYPKTSRHSLSDGDALAEEKTGRKSVEMSSKTDDAVTSALKNNCVENASVKEKDGDCLAADSMDDTLVGRRPESPHKEDRCGSASELMDNQVSQDIDCNLRPCSAKRKVKLKREDNGDNFKLSNFHSSPISDLKIDEKPSDYSSDIVKDNEAVVPSSSLCKNKVGDVDTSSEVVPDDHSNKPKELPGNFCHGKQEVEGSKGSFETQKGFLETKDGPDSAKDPSKSEALGCLQKMPTRVGKSSPTSSTMNSKSLSQDFKSEDAEVPKSLTKQGVMVDCNIHAKNENCPSDAAKDENPKKFVRERSKSSLHSNSKVLHSSRSLQNSVSKQASSEARDSVHSSSKASSGHQTSSMLGSSETNALHHQKASQLQNKVSSVPQKVEKVNQTNVHSSSKANQNHVSTMNPSPTSNSSMLSDEELALLLHQELNSSPRVPRVPRARHTGSLPQLNSTSATSMLMKRTTSAGGKDHYLVSRRKYKDASRDGFCSSREPEDDAKMIEKEKGPSSSDQRKLDMEYVEDTSVKEGGHASVIASNTITSNVVSATSGIANSSPLSPSEEQNFSLIRSSPRNISDDDTATAGRPVHHTLPGLINDIMSKGKRMTYEELCNAVLPHWHNLRKHNGERYAYSSHSQAVLDCLRNRHEWARLVDRGPKTNTNRKRRKLDAEESDDSGYGKGRTAKEVEGKNFDLQKEEFPKGKRKARKRRRLALQGRAVNDVRRQKADSLTDEDVGPFSNSSEESMFSEDEIHVGRIGPAGSTSDEAGSA